MEDFDTDRLIEDYRAEAIEQTTEQVVVWAIQYVQEVGDPPDKALDRFINRIGEGLRERDDYEAGRFSDVEIDFMLDGVRRITRIRLGLDEAA